MTEEIKPPETGGENLSIPDAASARSMIEAILFAAGYPVEYSKIAAALGLELCQVRMLADEMAESFYRGRGIRLMLYADSCQLCSREEYAETVRGALGLRRGVSLSPSSLEVLAVVAYHQPVTRAYIEQIRGSDSAYALGQLIDRELVAVCGQLDAPGRPRLYGTTDAFLRLFGIKDLGELPSNGLPQTPEAQGTEPFNI